MRSSHALGCTLGVKCVFLSSSCFCQPALPAVSFCTLEKQSGLEANQRVPRATPRRPYSEGDELRVWIKFLVLSGNRAAALEGWRAGFEPYVDPRRCLRGGVRALLLAVRASFPVPPLGRFAAAALATAPSLSAPLLFPSLSRLWPPDALSACSPLILFPSPRRPPSSAGRRRVADSTSP